MPKSYSSVVAASTPGHVRGMWALGALLAAGSAALVLSLSAWAGAERQAMPADPNVAHMGTATGMEGHGHRHGMHGLPFSGRHLARMLDKIDATPVQREQIKPLADQAAADLKAMHEEGRALHEQALKLWAQPKIDGAAAEQLRLRMLAHHDKVSKRMLQAALDMGKVLTAEQRAQIAEHMQKRHERMKSRMNGHMDRHQAHHGGQHGMASQSGASAPKE